VVARFRDQFLETPREGYAACCDALAAWDAREQIASITVPTLAIAAADDPSTPPEHLEAIAAAIPGTELIVVADAAHIVNIAQPEAFANAILSHALLEEAG
jgi:3-oxoadipate enol-lactonase